VFVAPLYPLPLRHSSIPTEILVNLSPRQQFSEAFSLLVSLHTFQTSSSQVKRRISLNYSSRIAKQGKIEPEMEQNLDL
jgi:hypothetical protein